MLLYVSILFQHSPLQSCQVTLLFAVSESMKGMMVSFMLAAIEIGVVETLLVSTYDWTATVAGVLACLAVLARFHLYAPRDHSRPLLVQVLRGAVVHCSCKGKCWV